MAIPVAEISVQENYAPKLTRISYSRLFHETLISCIIIMEKGAAAIWHQV